MSNANEILLASLIEQGIISQEDFDKKVEEYSIPVKKEKDIINSMKSAIVLYQEALDSSSSIEEIREAKINQLKQLCSESVYAGFYSESLGHSFGFNDHDQANISQQLILFLMDSIAIANIEYVEWKTLADGVVSLTKNQFMQLVSDAKEHKMSNQKRFWELEHEVLSASSIEEIKSINW